MHEEQHRAGRLAGLRRAQPLAVHPQGDVALLRPVFVAPDLRAVPRGGDSLPCRQCAETAGDESKAGAPDDGATRQPMIEIRHDVLQPLRSRTSPHSSPSLSLVAVISGMVRRISIPDEVVIWSPRD